MHRSRDWDWDDLPLEGDSLFPGIVGELCSELDAMDDLGLLWQVPDRAELRNHDCMWAGLCVSEKHERDAVRLERFFLPATPKRPKVIAPTNSRSVLLPPPPRLPDRPDTPESELELDLPYLCDLLGDQWLSSVVPSEVTGQVASCSTPPPPTPSQPPRTVTSYTNLISDHCYYSTLPPNHAIHTDNLGVQTPSDSEEEIDVETVADARKPGRGASSPCSMPTDPTAQDRRHLQRTVSSMMRRGRPPLALADRRRRKRRYSSGSAQDYQCARKSVKRKQYRPVSCKRKQRHLQNRNSSSDSDEVETTERRSLHNNLERQRRIDLRNAFEELRVLVPETRDHDKAAKVVILNSGAVYCQQLEYNEAKLYTEKMALKKQQERLREQLASLRRSLARVR